MNLQFFEEKLLYTTPPVAASDRETPVSKSLFPATLLERNLILQNFPGHLFYRAPLAFYRTTSAIQVSDQPAEKKYLFHDKEKN